MIHFPSKCRIYEFINGRGLGIASEWTKEIKNDKDLLARFHQKIDLLEQNGTDLPPNLLSGTKFKHIDKLRGCLNFSWSKFPDHQTNHRHLNKRL